MNRAKRQRHRRCQHQYDVDWISETLLVPGITGTRGIEQATVIADLDFASNVGAIRISVVQQQLPRAQPAWIEIREIASRALPHRALIFLVGDEDVLDIEPHTRGHEHCQQQAKSASTQCRPRPAHAPEDAERIAPCYNLLCLCLRGEHVCCFRRASVCSPGFSAGI